MKDFPNFYQIIKITINIYTNTLIGSLGVVILRVYSLLAWIYTLERIILNCVIKTA